MNDILKIILAATIGGIVANQIQHELWELETDNFNPRIVRNGSLAVVLLLAIGLAYIMQV